MRHPAGHQRRFLRREKAADLTRISVTSILAKVWRSVKVRARFPASHSMSALFLKRFLRNPFQVASVVPSSRTLIRRVSGKMDHSGPRVIAEYGPGEGCHTREIVRRMHPESRLLLFELDAALCGHLKKQFADDKRISVHNADCAALPDVLKNEGLEACDYIVSGIPFSILEKGKKR